MGVGICCDESGEGQRAEDDGQQHEQSGLLHRPERWGVGSIEHVLRGKIPGNPG